MKINCLKYLSAFQHIAPINELLLVLSQVTNISTSMLLIKDEFDLSKEQDNEFKSHIDRMANKEPLAYVLGEWGFYDLMFNVTPAVLIPRPETEHIIELILEKYKDRNAELSFLDIGTGSGIIPITIATKFPNAKFTAIDISADALTVAMDNAVRHQVADRFTWLRTDLIPPNLSGSKFDIITANLPYIPSGTVRELDIFEIEPTLALDGGEKGYELIEETMKRLVDQKIEFFIFILEIEYRQGQILNELSNKYFPDRKCVVHKDLAGHDRTVLIE